MPAGPCQCAAHSTALSWSCHWCCTAAVWAMADATGGDHWCLKVVVESGGLMVVKWCLKLVLETGGQLVV